MSSGALLGHSLNALGRSWAVVRLSWAPLGALLGHLGAILRPRMAIGSERREGDNHCFFSRIWDGFWPVGGLVCLLGHPGNHIEASRAIMSNLGNHFGFSEALLE
eukprot:9503182-Pyramimonas_sp.AAC.1